MSFTRPRVEPMPLSLLLEGIEVLSPPSGDPVISQVTDHSGRVEPGALFVAVKGYSTDGHRYISQAVERGAVAVVHEVGEVPKGVVSVRVRDSRVALALLGRNLYGNPRRDLVVIGITGTNGKTTVAHAIAHVLDGLGVPNAVLGTVGHRIAGVELEASHTTPSALELWRLLALAREGGAKVVAMEVSSHALEMERVFGVEFDASVFTNLTQDHLDFHETMESYFEAKRRLFTEFTKGISVVNACDPYGERLHSVLDGGGITYGLVCGDVSLHYRGRILGMGAGGMRLLVEARGTGFELSSPLVGEHNAYNLLATLAVLSELKLAGVRELSLELEGFRGVKGRLERVETGELGFSLFIDYAHTPHALESVMKALIPVKERRLWVVFGCGGDRDRGKRPKMGRIASHLADVAVITSDNPRSEDPEAIIGEILEGAKGGAEIVVEPDRERAIEFAITNAKPGDVVLVAGKGHETYQIFADRTIHFDDAEVATRVVAALKRP